MKDYDQGRRDGYDKTVDESKEAKNPKYKEGVIKGILERLKEEK